MIVLLKVVVHFGNGFLTFFKLHCGRTKRDAEKLVLLNVRADYKVQLHIKNSYVLLLCGAMSRQVEPSLGLFFVGNRVWDISSSDRIELNAFSPHVNRGETSLNTKSGVLLG